MSKNKEEDVKKAVYFLDMNRDFVYNTLNVMLGEKAKRHHFKYLGRRKEVLKWLKRKTF